MLTTHEFRDLGIMLSYNESMVQIRKFELWQLNMQVSSYSSVNPYEWYRELKRHIRFMHESYSGWDNIRASVSMDKLKAWELVK